MLTSGFFADLYKSDPRSTKAIMWTLFVLDLMCLGFHAEQVSLEPSGPEAGAAGAKGELTVARCLADVFPRHQPGESHVNFP